MSNKIAINEKMRPEENWFKDAYTQTLESLPKFIDHVMNDYQHDYGTICHAVAACALAAVHAADNLPNGGITGYQAGFVMWDIIRQMNYPTNKCGMKLLDYDNMLYPQYANRFQKTIRENTWKALQEQARELLNTSKTAHPAVRAHWESIAAGNIPFGFTIRED